MPTEITVALITFAGTLITALLSRNREAARSKRDKTRVPAARPTLVFFAVLATGLAITSFVFAYAATTYALSKDTTPQEVMRGETLQNKTRRSFFVSLMCNATAQSKDMDARLGKSPDSLTLAASESGGDRMSAAVVVPPGWYYRIDVTQVPGLGCRFERWPI